MTDDASAPHDDEEFERTMKSVDAPINRLRWIAAIAPFAAVVLLLLTLPLIIDSRESSEAARAGVDALRRNNAVNACRASISNVNVSPAQDALFSAVVRIVVLNTLLDLATRHDDNVALTQSLEVQFDQAQAELAQAQTGLVAARDKYQAQIKRSGSDPGGFVRACKRQGLLDPDS